MTFHRRLQLVRPAYSHRLHLSVCRASVDLDGHETFVVAVCVGLSGLYRLPLF